MGKRLEVIDAYVRLDLRDPGDFHLARIGGQVRTEKELDRDLAVLLSAARKRLHKLDDEFGGAEIIKVTNEVCEHCGEDWQKDSKTCWCECNE